MGLFGGSTTYVSSVVYNMAGDVAQRPDYLKSTVLGQMLGNSKFSMGEVITGSYLKGPGINLRGFHRWAKHGHMSLIGVPFSQVWDESDLIGPGIANEIPASTIGNDVYISNYEIGSANPNAWVVKYLYNESQDNIPWQYGGVYDPATGTIDIIKKSNGSIYATFTPDDYDPTATYIKATYVERVHSTSAWVGIYGFTYRIGSGNAALDALANIRDNAEDEFIPAIPVRLDNKFLSAEFKPDVYLQAKKAYKKLTRGQKFDKLIAKLKENTSLGDIDNIFLVNGVALNSVEPKSKKYIAKFFEKMSAVEFTSWATYNAYLNEQANYEQAWIDWFQYSDTHGGDPRPPEPPLPPTLQVGTNAIQITTNGEQNSRLNIRVAWDAMLRETGTGLAKPDAKVQEVWWDTGSTWQDSYGNEVGKLYWQNSSTSWISYTVKNLRHENLIANGKSVITYLSDALADQDESSFILPLHYETLRSMSLVDSTQMCLSSSYLVMNCYKVVKQKWYQTGIFKIALFIAIIAITVATGGGAAPGLLGTAASVGAAVGATGLMAVIVGAVINALAAMVLMALVQKFSTAVFGAKLGGLIATIVTVVAMAVGGGLASGQSMSQIWGNLMSAQNIIGMTSAVGNGVAGYVQASAAEMQLKTQHMMEDYSKKMSDLSKKYLADFGYGRVDFDPLQLTNFALTYEPSESFLSRTLMTGSDIAEMSMDMLGKFAEATLDVNTIGS